MRNGTRVVLLHQADDPGARHGTVVGDISEDEVMVRWDNADGEQGEGQDGIDVVWADELFPLAVPRVASEITGVKRPGVPL